MSGESKTGAFIAEVHTNFVEELVEKFSTELYGIIMDNTSANINAMDLMQKQYPQAIFVGCAAHFIDLFFKVCKLIMVASIAIQLPKVWHA